jgi:hypothetical protein
MSEQNRYWQYFVETYGHSRYLHKYYEKCERIDRAISIFMAIATNGSVAGWLIWKHVAWVWAVVIAVSQLINAVKGLLPYSKRKELLRDASQSYAQLVTGIEGDWHSVKSGSLSEAKISKRILKFKTKQDGIENKIFQKGILPEEKRLLSEAKEDTKNHFKRHYG